MSPATLHSKSNHHKQLGKAGPAGRTAGRTTERTRGQSEGGIPDPALASLIDAWPTLPKHVRDTIQMLVESQRRTER